MKKYFFAVLFWAGIALAADQGDINRYMKNAPNIKEHSQVGKVVRYITQKYKKDEEIARAALAWIVYNIDYDDYYFRQIDKDNKTYRDLSSNIPEQGDIIKTRLGVCKDIAALYSEMLQMAKIKSHIVLGCIAPPKDHRTCQANPHAWNVVWIKDRWELVDPTFAMGQANALQDISSNRRYARELKKRERRTSDARKPRLDRTVHTEWFMADPQKMAQDHQPDDKKWYLTQRRDRKKRD